MDQYVVRYESRIYVFWTRMNENYPIDINKNAITSIIIFSQMFIMFICLKVTFDVNSYPV